MQEEKEEQSRTESRVHFQVGRQPQELDGEQSKVWDGWNECINEEQRVNVGFDVEAFESINQSHQVGDHAYYVKPVLIQMIDHLTI